MKKIIRLTESDLTKIVKRVVEEQREGDKTGKLPIEKNDLIVLKHMEDNISPIPVGTLGLVRKVSRNQFGDEVAVVSWLNGQNLSLFTDYDDWEVIKKGSELSREEYLDFIEKYDDVRHNKN